MKLASTNIVITKMVFLLTCIFFAITTPVFAANHYVRSGASVNGNGSDWTNAYTALPSSLVRGDTYYIADGNYGNYTFDDPVSGSTPINIIKATINSHGTDIGWVSDYGDGVAYWGELSFQTSYYIFDGVKGYGRDVEEYGFQQNFTNRSATAKAFDVDGDYIIIRHVKSYWDNREDLSEVQSRWLEATTGSPNNITVSYCYVKELPGLPFYFISSSNILVEYFVMEGMHSDATYHAEIASIRGLTNLTVRFSWFMDGAGTGGWMSMEGNNTDWKIYGNVFEQTPLATGHGFGHGIFADNMGSSVTSGVFYNNTVANYTDTLRSGLAFWATTSPVEWRNNIVRNSKGFGNIGVDIASHNYLSDCPSESEFNTSLETNLQRDSLDPFADSARNSDGEITDWQLSGSNLPLAGYQLPSPFNESCLNRLWQGPNASCITRGADGHWDRGAIEYFQGLSLPNPPTNLRIM